MTFYTSLKIPGFQKVVTVMHIILHILLSGVIIENKLCPWFLYIMF